MSSRATMHKVLVKISRLPSSHSGQTRRTPIAPELRIVRGETIAIFALLCVQFVPSIGPALSMGALTLWALQSSKAAMQALSLGVLLIFLNRSIFPVTADVQTLKWFLLAVSALKVYRSVSRPKKPAHWLPALTLFMLVCTIITIFSSSNVLISAFKLGSFGFAVYAVLLGLRDRTVPSAYWLDWFYTLHVVVVTASIPFLFTSAGHSINSALFQGILNHSQALGIYLAPTAMLLSSSIFVNRVRLFPAFVVAVTWYLIYASGCRTAVFAVSLSVMITALSALFRGDLAHIVKRTKAMQCGIVVAFCIPLVLIPFGDRVVQSVLHFSAKSSAVGESIDFESATDTATNSRASQIAKARAAFTEHPFTGVGFGLGSEDLMGGIKTSNTFGLPVSAPTEAGFIHVAAPMQIGVFGTACFLILLVALFRPILRFASIPVILFAVTAFSVNFGEMIIFSVGGLGLHMWMVIACAYEHSVRRQSGE